VSSRDFAFERAFRASDIDWWKCPENTDANDDHGYDAIERCRDPHLDNRSTSRL
jgi:hypothetical protein